MPIFASASDRQTYFKSSQEVKLALSPQAVQTHIVGVGTLLYLDLQHPAIPAELRNELRFVKHIGSDTPTPATQDNPLFGTTLPRFARQCGNNELFYPVMQCMLLYEMPESVVAHNDYCDIDSQVWVGVRQVANFKNKHKYSSRYLTVPTKALVSLEKLATAGMSVAVFDSCLS
jgi:hypothetical protein